MKRVYFHMRNMEEYHSVMWKTIPVEKRDAAVEAAANLMRDPNAFELACVQAVTEWPNSSIANFTASSINHKAWLGHAACCIVCGSSEDLTRAAWNTLNEEQQRLANDAAQRVIDEWRKVYMKASHA